MSYIRIGSKYDYVKGESRDYIYPYREKNKLKIKDYGSITNETLVELFCRHAKINDLILKKYLIKRLAEKLNVKMKKGV